MLTMCVIIRVFTYVTAQGHWLVFAGPAYSGRLCPKCPHLLPELFFPHPGNGLLFVLISLLGKYGSGKHKFKFYFHCRHCLLLTFVRILLRPFGVFFFFSRTNSSGSAVTVVVVACNQIGMEYEWRGGSLTG